MNKETESFCMPIRAEPYAHQQTVFDLACRKFGIHILTGTMVQKRQQTAFKSTDKLQIIAANYETIRRLEPELLRFHADLIIADEGQKSRRTVQSSQRLYSISAMRQNTNLC